VPTTARTAVANAEGDASPATPSGRRVGTGGGTTLRSREGSVGDDRALPCPCCPPELTTSITAFVLLDVEVAHVGDVAEALCEIEGVTEVYSVTGRYDLIAKIKVARNEDLADVVTGRVGAITGIRESETVIAFRSYSEQALDAGFSLGQDPA